MKLHTYERFDGTIVLSKFHGEAIRQLDGYQGKFHYASNGIDPLEFPEPDESKRDPHAAIYASAPNRGLDFLLEAWPLIRKAVPDATLKVYYSWVLTEQMMEKRPELKAQMGPLLTHLRAKFEELKDQGVTYVGGVGHSELHAAYRSSGVWTYPPVAFNEISCISALKAQASGCWPVVIPTGALPETCMFGTHVPVGSSVEKYAEAVIQSMKNHQTLDRKTMREWALKQNWDQSADQFIEILSHKSERITIYAGAFIRQFDGTGSADGKPLGGSEEAVIAMAHGLAAEGKEVIVYCALPDGEARDDGTTVRWIDSSKFFAAGAHGTLLAWRCPSLVPKLKGNGYPVILWLMDPHYRAPAYDYSEADDVVFLTETHKDIIAREDGYDGGGSVVHVGLPVLPELGNVTRDPNAVMWAVSPDRGLLEFLQEVWPKVVGEVPKAKLHIFYGLEPLELNGKKELADKIRAEIADHASIVYHGGVTDAELYEWYQRCSVFAYPGKFFEETQSISICKSMAMGCYPVTNEQGCLPEVLNACGGTHVPDEVYVESLIRHLKEPVSATVRDSMANAARGFFSVKRMVDSMLKVIAGVNADGVATTKYVATATMQGVGPITVTSENGHTNIHGSAVRPFGPSPSAPGAP